MRGFVDKADGTLCLNELVGLLVETDDFRTSSTSCDCHSESDKVRIRIWKCRFPYERILEFRSDSLLFNLLLWCHIYSRKLHTRKPGQLQSSIAFQEAKFRR